MRWKLTFSYVMSIVLIVTAVIVTNVIAVVGYVSQGHGDGFSYVVSGQSYIKPENYVRDFAGNINFKDGAFSLNEPSQRFLVENNVWLQILNEDGRVLYGFNQESAGLNEKLREKYTPMMLIHNYKYADPSTVFVGEKKIGHQSYTYLMGFPFKDMERHVFQFNKDYIKSIMGSMVLILLGINIILAILFGLVFSGKLTRPVAELIQGIETLSQKNYGQPYDEKGLYKEVHVNMNQLAAQLAANESEHKDLEQMREEWITNISHDIKTPLASIRGYSEMLSGAYEFTTEEVHEYAKIIEQKSVYLEELVNDLNLSTRLRHGQLKLDLKQVNLVQWVRENVIDLINSQPDRHLTFECVEKEILAEIDPLLIKRVLQNLVQNAYVHNTSGVEVQVFLKVEGNAVSLCVKDNGKGIREEELHRIFTRYYRGSHTGSKHVGTGLGMAISKEIVEAHGAQLTVQSELGRGTLFTAVFRVKE